MNSVHLWKAFGAMALVLVGGCGGDESSLSDEVRPQWAEITVETSRWTMDGPLRSRGRSARS